MKKIFLSILLLIISFGWSQNARLITVEQKVKRLEISQARGTATEAGASIYPVTGELTGGGGGALDKITNTEDKDAALVIFNANTTWGDAFFVYSLDVDGAGTEASPYIIDSGDGGDEDWEWLDIYGHRLYGNLPFKSVTDSCTLGVDCDGTLVRLAWGGIIQNTVTAKIITLPEIVASSPTAIQVIPGAHITIMNRDASETTTVTPNAGDKITLDGVQGSAGEYIISTGNAISVNVYSYLVADAAVDDVLINTGGLAAGKTFQTLVPAMTANDYIYLVEGDTAATTGVYNAGQLIVNFFGHPVLS